MTRSTLLLDYLSDLATERFSGTVFRATGQGIDPMAPSNAGGRWMIPNGDMAVLYTSTSREGALAEICFHLSQFNPLPSKPIVVHSLSLETTQTIRIKKSDFSNLNIDEARFGERDYKNTQLVGDCAAFLQRDSLIVPSARWSCENLVIFYNNHQLELPLTLLSSETVDWQLWARRNGFLSS